MKYLGVFLSTCTLIQAADYMTGQAARAEIGQSTFTTLNSDHISASIIGAASGIAYANNTLFIADANRVQATPVNNRVLIYHNVAGAIPSPTANITQGVRCPVCSAKADVVLGQTDFTSSGFAVPPNQASFRTPTGVASDGQVLAVADTDNNRILIWKSIPHTIGTPADIVLGQPDFVTVQSPPPLDAKSFRAPQGLWIQGTRFFVADTQHHRVLVWNHIPTSNNQPADYVLGEPNFTTAPSPVVTSVNTAANNLFYPVSVSSDGIRLFVADLGNNRVLIWNSIPTQTQQPADVVVGQPDMVSNVANNSFNRTNNTPILCKAVPTTSTSTSTTPTFPALCGATLNFPRFALSDGARLYIADGGNDRILVYEKIPTTNGARADKILGQQDEFSDTVTDNILAFTADANIGRSSPAEIRSPMALAWDGTNLYASDPFNMRVMVFTPGVDNIPVKGISNAASGVVFAFGTITITGTIHAGDTATVTIAGTSYTYTVTKTDTLATITANLANLINGVGGGTPDPNVIAKVDLIDAIILVTSKVPGTAGNSIGLASSVSASAQVTLTASNAVLNGGQDTAEVGPGSLVTINGFDLSDTKAIGKPSAQGYYPTSLAGVQVYFDGIAAPLLYVSPTQINTQVPFEVQDSSGISAVVITEHKNGVINNTAAVSVPIVAANPGVFAQPGKYPQDGIAIHGTNHGTTLVDIGGVIEANDVATISINTVLYNYTVQSSDSLATIRDALIAAINKDPKVPVIASAAGQYTRVLLTAKAAGTAGNSIAVVGSASANAMVTVTALQGTTCCAGSSPGALVSASKPAVAGEILTVYATGLGLVTPAGDVHTGRIYQGPLTTPSTVVDDAQLGSRVADVISAGLVPGMTGVYAVLMKLDPTTTAQVKAQLFIAQGAFTSNFVIIPVVAHP
jgi:uncharacterized protein (TIGR03437 family)